MIGLGFRWYRQSEAQVSVYMKKGHLKKPCFKQILILAFIDQLKKKVLQKHRVLFEIEGKNVMTCIV